MSPCEHGNTGDCLSCHVEALRVVHGCYDSNSEEHGESPCDICPDDETRAARRAEVSA